MLGQLVGAGLNHHHAVRGAGDHQVQITPFDLPITRIKHEVIPEQTHPHGCHRAVEGDARQQRGNRCARHRKNISGDPLIKGQAGGHHLQVVAQPAGEQWPHRAVNQSGRERGPFGGAALTTHVAAGNAASCIKPLLVIADQRQEINAFSSA